ncbi:unnamed protein product, partial [Ixodes hexagonus]
LLQLKQRLQDIWKDEFTDSYLLRWLRAREFDGVKAEKLLRENLAWRRQNGVDSLIETYKPPDVLTRYLPGGMCNHDRGGRPLWAVPYGGLDVKGLLQCVSIEEVVKHVIYQMELLSAEMKRQTEKLGKLVDTFTVVCDYENFSLRQVYCLQAIDLTRHIMVLYESHYPEILERCLIINAPGFFPVFWRFIRPFFTERTVSKIEMCTHEGWQPVLLRYVDPSQLPVHWGGNIVGPNGDKKCTHMVGRGGEVPSELYLKNSPRVSVDPAATTCSLERGKKLEVPVKVERAGASLRWRFQTNPGHDLGFGLTQISGDNDGPKELLPLSRVKCDQDAENGEVCCSEPGTYIFTFDNSYSWFTKKQLSYVFEVKHPEDISSTGSR